MGRGIWLFVELLFEGGYYGEMERGLARMQRISTDLGGKISAYQRQLGSQVRKSAAESTVSMSVLPHRQAGVFNSKTSQDITHLLLG